MTKDELDFSLANTRCVHGHWEDPDRGERSTDQLMLSRGVQILASHAAIPKMRAGFSVGIRGGEEEPLDI